MRTATVAEAKERLEELIAAARAGETVEIRDADGVVALAPQLHKATGEPAPVRNPRLPAPETLEEWGVSGAALKVLTALLDEREESR